VSAGPRIAFSTLAFPDASLATALSLGRAWGYRGVELRLIDGELIDPFPGWISVEWEKRWHPEIEAPEVALPQHLRLLESWLRDPQEAV
jgi:hypothetical protein